MRQCCFSRTQIYQWRNGHIERKKRKPKQFPEETVENASSVVAQYPHFSGRKGQGYMIYHRQGYISMNAYDEIKKDVKRVLIQELSVRKEKKSTGKYYEHIKPGRVGEIWAEDFTDLIVCGQTFKLAILIDVFDQFKLGVAVGKRATANFVAKPVHQALAANGGLGPEKFILSDNGLQYISDEHNRMLTTSEIVHKCIPRCAPQYNGWVECEIKEFKNVFYNVWERRERNHTDKEKNLLQRVESSVNETTKLLNEVVPRPTLGGVTPADVHFSRHIAKKEENRKYYEIERKRKNDAPWSRKYWDILKAGIESTKMTAKELIIKLAFYVQKPLRRIAKLNKEGVG
jgi:transposase InsO family protein